MDSTATAPATCEIARLPDDLLSASLARTGPLDACRAAAVSPAFRAAADADAVWSSLLPRDLPPLADGELPDDPHSTKKQLFMRLSDAARPVLLADGLTIHNESSCSSPADGTPISPADDTRTSPDEESPRSHSSTCHLDSGQQPHPRNMENEIDSLDRKIMGMIGCLSSSLNLSEGWYHGPKGIELILGKMVVMENFKTATKEMVKERIEKLERMVKDYHENRRSSLPYQMLYVFNDVGRQYYESVPQSPLSYGKRAALVSEELEAPSTKRARSESVDMVMYLSHPDAASKLLISGFSMDDCTSRAQRLFQGHQDDRRILYSALSLLRQNIEIRQSFMTLEESYARGYIEHELKDSGML